MATIKKPVMLKTPIAKAAKKTEKPVAVGPGIKAINAAKPAKPGKTPGKTVQKGLGTTGAMGEKIGAAMRGKK
jgi:hypothetical protein